MGPVELAFWVFVIGVPALVVYVIIRIAKNRRPPTNTQ
jgi:hypothetical protein